MSTEAQETLWKSDDLHLTVERSTGVVRFTRTSRSLPALPELRATFDAVFAVLDGLPREDYGFLTDLRQAVGRSDEDFEATMHEVRPRLYAGFRRVAVLVRSEVGRLQIHRLSRLDGIADRLLVTTDEDEALAHVRRPPR